MSVEWTPARAAAQARYNEKTFKKIAFAMRLESDMDIINDWETAKANGQTNREWLRDLYEGAITKESVERAMRKCGVQQNIINNVLKEL